MRAVNARTPSGWWYRRRMGGDLDERRTGRFRATEVLTADEIRELCRPSDLRGLLAVATSWAIVVATLALVAWRPSPLTWIFALVILGGRHLALAVLMHEAAHRTLCRRRWLNDLVGQWLCAYPAWQDIHRYREQHLAHHAHTGSDRDPDLELVRPFPCGRRALARKFARDLLGISALRRVIGLLLMDLGYLEYNTSGGAAWIPGARDRRLGEVLRVGVARLHGVVLVNAALIGVTWSLGHVELYALWVASWATTYSLFLRIRAIAEHACTPDPGDPLGNTRTVIASPLARLLMAPHRVSYHLEHHLLMTVPFFRLPRLHALLAGRGALTRAPIATSYVEVLRLASGGAASAG